MSHPNDLNPLLAVNEPHVDFFQAVWIFEGGNGVRKIHAVLAKVIGGFAIVHSYCTRKTVPDIGSRGKQPYIAGSSGRDVMSGLPMRRAATTEEVSSMVAFLGGPSQVSEL